MKTDRPALAALARRNRLTEQTMREIWSQVDESARYALIFRSSVQRASFSANSPNTDVWFRDLIAMRSQHTLGIHRSLAARLRDEEHKAATQSEGDPEYLDLLRRLKAQADERLFRVAQEYTALLVRFARTLLHEILLGGLTETCTPARLPRQPPLLGDGHSRAQLVLPRPARRDARLGAGRAE